MCLDGVVDQMRTVLKSRDIQCTFSAFGVESTGNETVLCHPLKQSEKPLKILLYLLNES